MMVVLINMVWNNLENNRQINFVDLYGWFQWYLDISQVEHF